MSLWWKCPVLAQEKPLTQAEAVSLALRQSPQSAVAAAVRDAAQLQAERDKPVARPTLNAIATGTAQGPRVNLPNSSAVVVPEGAGRLDLILEQVIYRAGIGAARQRYMAQTALVLEDYRRSLADVAQTAHRAYLDVLRAQSGVRTAQDGAEAAVRYQDLVARQIAAGVAKPVDAETVKAQVAEAQAGVQQAQNNLELARLAFNQALGRPLTAPVTLDVPGALPAIPADPAQAVAVAQQDRPELVTLGLNLRMAQAGVSLARTQSQPTVTARGQYTEQTPTALIHEHYYGASLVINWPLLDGGKARQDTREAQAQVARLLAERDVAQSGIELDVRRAWQTMRNANAQIISAQTRLAGLEAAAAVAGKAYEVGRGTVLDVQAAQREVRAAREAELRATYDLYAAELDFAHAQGLDIKDVDAVLGKK